MKKSRFTEEQMVTSCASRTRHRLVRSRTSTGSASKAFTTGDSISAGPEAAGVKRFKQLEQLDQEKARLKKMPAERDRELDVMKEVNAKNVASAPARRQAGRVPESPGPFRASLHYELTLAVRDAPVPAAMSILSVQYPPYGCRRIEIFLERQASHPVSADKAWPHGLCGVLLACRSKQAAEPAMAAYGPSGRMSSYSMCAPTASS
ncbi:hypothetical protein LMG29542_07325 [Paraburkholderia humisilvae]|uniref:Uncharacterized protein n=1 Tax=Paraburkholderia humisilvae TaxID=627669 RepID=A0A6J5F712_9BURK|nr:hypothetical protein LMG29542_07325 [Paraburkholderia humisilvae]